ncbi:MULTISPECIES: DUF3108 domain-containing protein [Rhizobium]|uniref:DUF3108 domain-containing protein n=1 Tax=Rhizobium lusitanum TaxID=293958 RepID=A0A1C3UKC4_9HYPH|nr:MULTISPECIES: DUF3108 domain-containing protein [Rhizobium]NKJ06299.1 hypothetical protein [Rhizobium sp. SG741]NKJ38177.1 hypothetical protein [Rhizobium sp. SG570]SCB15817.1 Protein of unknown function [Rhizobium lusitanum]
MVQILKCLIISAVVASMPSLASADMLRHETQYRVSLAGLPIARADFKTEVTGNQFTIRGDITSAGLADLVTSIDAKTDVAGVVSDNKLQATHYSLFYKNGKKERTYDVAYTNGNVTSNTIVPEPKRSDSWIPLSVSDLKSVLDPISGMIFPITPSLNLCNQTLAVFDGEMRMDLKLSPKGSHPFSTDGFKGKTIACGVRFTPKSGYKSTRKDYLYLAKSDNMEIWFAKADTMNVYAPVYVRIPTQYGTVTITAVKYGS